MTQEKLLAIALEIGLLAFLGLLYYLFQKRRILKHAKNELIFALEDFLYDINCHLEENKNTQDNSTLQDFVKEAESYLERKDIKGLCDYLSKSDFKAPNDQLAETWKSLREIILINSD
jgi:hypothetical protein